jgi:hypothetical protein
MECAQLRSLHRATCVVECDRPSLTAVHRRSTTRTTPTERQFDASNGNPEIQHATIVDQHLRDSAEWLSLTAVAATSGSPGRGPEVAVRTANVNDGRHQTRPKVRLAEHSGTKPRATEQRVEHSVDAETGESPRRCHTRIGSHESGSTPGSSLEPTPCTFEFSTERARSRSVSTSHGHSRG